MGSRFAIRFSPFTRRTETRGLRFIRAREVLAEGDGVIVGVSGGPDSTALLLILAQLRDELGLRITAAHFDHKLRTREEAEGDRAFVEGLSKALRVPFVVGAGDVRGRARRHKESIEEAARVMRYRFLGREAKRANATAVAVGHTLDDRAETVLLHAIRGSGLDGLAAMPPRAPWPFGRGPDVARPLLELGRADTERYCRESGIEPRRDPTNDLPIATRNRLRQELMPVLRRFNPQVAKSLNRLADAAARDLSFIDQFSDGAWRMLAGRGKNSVSLRKESLLRWAEVGDAIPVRLLRRAADEVSGGASSIGAEHISLLMQMLRRPRGRVTMPGGLNAVVNARLITIYRGERPAPTGIPETWLNPSGTVRAGAWLIQASPAKERPPRVQRMEAYINAEALGGNPVVRSRRPGDRLRPIGLAGTKKLQDIFVDAKVAEEERDQVPIVSDENGIIWVAGHCVDERVAVTETTKHLLRLRARRG